MDFNIDFSLCMVKYRVITFPELHLHNCLFICNRQYCFGKLERRRVRDPETIWLVTTDESSM